MDNDRWINIRLDKKLVRTFIIVLIILIGFVAYLGIGWKDSAVEATEFSRVIPASVEEIYPLFICSCCGKPLDPQQPCCNIAKEMIGYISTLSDSGISNEEIVLTTVKKYGINLLINESMKNEVRKELGRLAPTDRPKISIDLTSHDFGDVSFTGGAVKTVMTIKNEGGTDLVLNEMDTSCGCTSSSITKDSVEGPVFSMKMHGTNPVGWSVNIEPGETVFLNIYYDPTVHPDLRGPVTRTVSIFSNDPVEFQKEVRIIVNQVD